MHHMSFPSPRTEDSSTTARGTAFVGGSLVELLRFRARVQPDEQAFVFLRDGEHPSHRVTYAELDRRARAVAAQLQMRVPAGARALLVYPPGLEFITAFFGCLYGQVVAVPLFPPRWRQPDRNLSRLMAVAADAGPSVVLSTTETAGQWERAVADGTVPRCPASPSSRRKGDVAMVWVATDALDERAAAAWRDPGVDRRTLAFLQYTSGSTAVPKGVMVSHGNLLHNLSYGFHEADTDRSTVSVSWLPVVHDMGLIDGVLQPIYSGCPAYLMSPTAFLQRPVRWLQAISRCRATRSGGPNFAYDLCARRVDAEGRAALDLSSWRDAYNAAEPVRSDTLETFATTFAGCGFRNTVFRPCFGLAEATLLVTSGRHTVGSSRPSPVAGVWGRPAGVSCGYAAFGTSVAVVDPKTCRLCPPDVVGEIWVTGPSVAAGYWHRPQDTSDTFDARTADGAGPFLRTGDLGVMGDDGLHITGRLKDVLIVRGAKHYPQDLEQTTAQQHSAIRRGCVAAFSVGHGPSGDRIGLVAEADPGRLDTSTAADEMIAAIRTAITDVHGVQPSAVTLVAPGTIAKTTSGKLQRFVCRDAFLAGTLTALAAWREPTARVPSPANRSAERRRRFQAGHALEVGCR